MLLQTLSVNHVKALSRHHSYDLIICHFFRWYSFLTASTCFILCEIFHLISMCNRVKQWFSNLGSIDVRFLTRNKVHASWSILILLSHIFNIHHIHVRIWLKYHRQRWRFSLLKSVNRLLYYLIARYLSLYFNQEHV